MSARTRYAIAALVLAVGPAHAQVLPDQAVDRNIADTGPNAASLRVTQPGIGQFGVGSLLVDRFGDTKAHQTTRFDRAIIDPRVSQRYLLQSPGYTALIDRPDYIGPSPDGGWAFNQKTLDGAEVLTLTPANTVFVLSPELLNPQAQPVERLRNDQARTSHISPIDYRIDPQGYADRLAPRIESNATLDATLPTPAYEPYRTNLPPRPETYRHPEIIERQRKLREERALEAEQAEREAKQAEDQAAEAQESSQNKDAGAQQESESEPAPAKPKASAPAE